MLPFWTEDVFYSSHSHVKMIPDGWIREIAPLVKYLLFKQKGLGVDSQHPSQHWGWEHMFSGSQRPVDPGLPD